MIYLLVILGIFSCSLSQLFLKKSANKEHKSRLLEIINPLVIISYMIFFCSLLVNIWAMGKGVQLKEMAMLESLGYIFVPLLSWLFLNETITKRMVLAIFIILGGIIIFYQ